ncbi:MAG: cupin domain-containing protein [Bacillota bacterium]
MFVKKGQGNYIPMIEGVKRRTLACGEKTLMIEVELAQGSNIPGHSHLHEQTGYLVYGKMIFNIDGQETEVNPGDSWAIPGNAVHSVKVLEDSFAVEVFSPVREDYK